MPGEKGDPGEKGMNGDPGAMGRPGKTVSYNQFPSLEVQLCFMYIGVYKH